jgi:zinc/manganese transport system permease protein
MTSDLLALLWAPFLMCLVLTGIHAYLGIHVIAREVVFVDIAMAQIAALGATAAFLLGFELDSSVSYAAALAFTVLGAGVLALTRTRDRHVSQEAIIGVVYAVSAAAAVLLADRAPHGAEHIRAMLVGSLLSVGPAEVAKVAALYGAVGLVHWAFRRPFLLISTDPAAAYREGWRVRVWDFVFYATFGVVVTSSVRVAGVLLVFSYLIVPALAGITLGGGIAARLTAGWAFGAVVSVLGIGASAVLHGGDGRLRVRRDAARARPHPAGPRGPASGGPGPPDAVARRAGEGLRRHARRQPGRASAARRVLADLLAHGVLAGLERRHEPLRLLLEQLAALVEPLAGATLRVVRDRLRALGHLVAALQQDVARLAAGPRRYQEGGGGAEDTAEEEPAQVSGGVVSLTGHDGLLAPSRASARTRRIPASARPPCRRAAPLA